MLVHRRTHMYIKCSQPEDISLFPEAQVLTILCASSLSLPFFLKVDGTLNNVASDAIFISFLCLLLGPPRPRATAQLMTFFCFRFPDVLVGSPGHDLYLSSITLNLLSPQLRFFMVLKCDLFVYHGN